MVADDGDGDGDGDDDYEPAINMKVMVTVHKRG